ncbi:MAG: rhodanese-like domain-containing protein [Gammaproteobacteria bacterium]|nr:rhodanese-like domain-containing protein [Gammaproteobacteria bacterium]
MRRIAKRLASSSVEQIAAGEPVYQSADSDQFAYYLLLGAIDILRDRVLIKRLLHTEDAARFPLVDAKGPTQIVRANTACVVLRIPRARLELGLASAINGGASDGTTHWMNTLLRSGVYARLPAQNIQLLFTRMHTFPMWVGDTIIDQGNVAIRRGARWLDIRYQDAFVRGSLPQAVNIPLAVLRIRRRTLPADSNFVVCSDDPELSAIGAFLLIESGFGAGYLNSSVLNHFAPAEIHVSPAVAPVQSSMAITTTATSIPNPALTLGASTVTNTPPFEPQASDLSATLTGRSLATLIEPLEAERRVLGSGDKTPTTPVNPAVDDPLEATHHTLSQLLDEVLTAERLLGRCFYKSAFGFWGSSTPDTPSCGSGFIRESSRYGRG